MTHHQGARLYLAPDDHASAAAAAPAPATATAAITDTGDLPANAPNDDSGRSQFDNVTNVNKPTIYIRLDDAAC